MIRKRLVLAGITGVPCFMIGTFLFTSLHSDGNLKPSEIAVVSAPEKQATVSNSFKSVPATRRFARQFSSECVFDLDHSSTFGLIPGRDRTPITKLAVASPALAFPKPPGEDDLPPMFGGDVSESDQTSSETAMIRPEDSKLPDAEWAKAPRAPGWLFVPRK